MDWVYVVTGHGQIWVFDTEELAEEFASVRGGCEWESCCVMSEYDGRKLIKEEIKERRAEERMRRAGL